MPRPPSAMESLRVRTPVGPLELDLAYGLKSRQFRLHLNVGFVW